MFAMGNLANVVTGEILDMPSKEFFLDCMERGNNLYENFRETKIVTKITALFHRIPKEVIKKCLDILRIVDIARARCYNINVLLSY